MGYPMYPPSLYRAISYASKLGVPMYITENGTPLTEDTEERSEWITGYLEQVFSFSSIHLLTHVEFSHNLAACLSSQCLSARLSA